METMPEKVHFEVGDVVRVANSTRYSDFIGRRGVVTTAHRGSGRFDAHYVHFPQVKGEVVKPLFGSYFKGPGTDEEAELLLLSFNLEKL